jgi:hypothetical protein
MRAILFAAVIASGCATMQRPAEPSYSAAYEVDANSMVPIIVNTTHAQNMRVAVIQQPDAMDRANFVVLPTDGGDATPLVIHLTQLRDSERFATCLGNTCRSAIAVNPVGANASGAAYQRAQSLLSALSESAWAERRHTN